MIKKIDIPQVEGPTTVDVFYNGEYYATMDENQFNVWRVELMRECLKERKDNPSINGTDLTPYTIKAYKDSNGPAEEFIEMTIDYNVNISYMPYEFAYTRRSLSKIMKMERELIGK